MLATPCWPAGPRRIHSATGGDAPSVQAADARLPSGVLPVADIFKMIKRSSPLPPSTGEAPLAQAPTRDSLMETLRLAGRERLATPYEEVGGSARGARDGRDSTPPPRHTRGQDWSRRPLSRDGSHRNDFNRGGPHRGSKAEGPWGAQDSSMPPAKGGRHRQSSAEDAVDKESIEDIEPLVYGEGGSIMSGADPNRMAHRPLTRRLPSSFSAFPLPSWLLDALTRQNVLQPTAVQADIIAALMERAPTNSAAERKARMPIIVRAQTGTGKSLGYLIGLLGQMHRTPSQRAGRLAGDALGVSSCTHLVIVPHAMLAFQLLRWIRTLVSSNAFLTDRLASVVRLLIPPSQAAELSEEGGERLLATTRGHSHILIGTPSELLEALSMATFSVGGCHSIVLDEADSMIKSLSQYAPLHKQMNRKRHPIPVMTFLTGVANMCTEHRLRPPRLMIASASMNRLARHDLAKNGLLPGGLARVICDVASLAQEESRCPPAIRHYHRMIAERDSPEDLVQMLTWIYQENAGKCGLVLMPSGRSKVALRECLVASAAIPAVTILADLPRASLQDLNRTLAAPSEEHGRLLLGSDMDARGLDLPMLDYVIVVDLPESPTHYMHMAGRVGRMGRPGAVYTIVAGGRQLERLMSIYSCLRLTSTPYVTSQ